MQKSVMKQFYEWINFLLSETCSKKDLFFDFRVGFFFCVITFLFLMVIMPD